jgi:hypothetical protein
MEWSFLKFLLGMKDFQIKKRDDFHLFLEKLGLTLFFLPVAT